MNQVVLIYFMSISFIRFKDQLAFVITIILSMTGDVEHLRRLECDPLELSQCAMDLLKPDVHLGVLDHILNLEALSCEI